MKNGKKLKIARIKKELTLEELAKITKLNIATLSRIENNKHKPNAITLAKLSKALNIELKEIL